MATTAYPQGVDAAWLATDALGFVAVFTTGGEGPIPPSALPAAVGEPDLETQIVSLPIVSAATGAASVPSSFVALAERGFFAYDWADVHRTQANATHKYELVCRPTQPVKLSTLPAAVQVVARATLLPGVAFSTATHVAVQHEGT